MPDYVALLKTSDLLGDVPDRRLRAIRELMQEVRIPAGETVFAKGETGDAVYLVAEGVLRLESDGVPVAVRRRGEWVGEVALIDNGERSASAIAQSDVVLLRWESECFHDVISKHPEVAYGIFRVLTRKLRQDIDIRVDLEMEQERWRQDIKRAREIQMGMLPQRGLTTANLEVSSYCRPAAEVGGDYYDFLEYGDGCVGLIIGDVTGHGFYAALFVAMAKSCLNTQARVDYAPERVMDAMRHTLTLSIQRSLLMTCCYVLLDPSGQRLLFSNAGHAYPYLYRARGGRLEKLEALDPLLGVQDLYDAGFSVAERPWESGDVLVMYSDGITECRDPQGEMFDHARLEACIEAAAVDQAAGIKERILSDLAAHCAGSGYGDDVALVVAKAR
jgi:serine phosphatase RsbU (regulator of sigma subunit)